MIKKEMQSKGAMVKTTKARGSTEEECGDRRGEIANEVMDIESQKSNIIFYQLDEDSQSSYLTQEI